MASGRSIIVGGGVNPGTPFTAGQFALILQSDPATLVDGNIRQDSTVSPPQVFVGEEGATVGATVLGGAIMDPTAGRSIAIGDGAVADSGVAGPNTDVNMHVVIGPGAICNPTAGQSLGNVIIGGGASSTGGAQNVVIGAGASKPTLGGANVIIGAGASISVISNNATVIGGGASATINAGAIVVLGSGAESHNGGETVIGSGAIGRGLDDIVIGSAAHSDNSNNAARNFIVGNGASVSSTTLRSMTLGHSSLVAAGHSDVILVGRGQVSTASNEIRIGNRVSGGTGSASTSLHIGGPPTEAAYPGLAISCVNGSGTDDVVGGLIITAPAGTGAAASAPIQFRTGVPTVSGTAAQAVRTGLRVDASVTADETDVMVWDVTKAALVRVSRGAADSGGAGFRALCIPN